MHTHLRQLSACTPRDAVVESLNADDDALNKRCSTQRSLQAPALHATVFMKAKQVLTKPHSSRWSQDDAVLLVWEERRGLAWEERSLQEVAQGAAVVC